MSVCLSVCLCDTAMHWVDLQQQQHRLDWHSRHVNTVVVVFALNNKLTHNYRQPKQTCIGQALLQLPAVWVPVTCVLACYHWPWMTLNLKGHNALWCANCAVLWLFIFIPPINVSFRSKVTDRRSGVANLSNRTMHPICTGAAAIMTLFTDIYHFCYHIQSDISSCAVKCESAKFV